MAQPQMPILIYFAETKKKQHIKVGQGKAKGTIQGLGKKHERLWPQMQKDGARKLENQE